MGRPIPHRAPLVALLGAAALAVGQPAPREWRARPIAVRSTPIALSPAEPDRRDYGALSYRGGLLLQSADPRFGGLSALHVSADGERLVAVSDEGQWLTAGLRHTGGDLVGLAAARLGPLLAPDGSPLAEKADQDAESLAFAGGAFVVGFERRHRLWSYESLAARPTPLPAPPGLEAAPPNGGLEALAALPGGGLLAVAEELGAGPGLLRGFVRRDDRWAPLAYRVHGPLRPSDAASLPGGDVLVLERSFSPEDGVRLRLRRLPPACAVAQAVLDPPTVVELGPPLALDNFEGLAARPGPRGETLVYLLSDDNFNKLQKTLLLLFELSPAPAGGCAGKSAPHAP